MDTPAPRTAETSLRIWSALLASLAASVGSVWLSVAMDLKACPLCLYQRACVFCTAAVLILAMLRKLESATAAVIALAPAVAALGIGLFHVYLEHTGALECPPGIKGWGSAPQQAAAAEVLITFFLLIASMPRLFPATVAVMLGIALGSFMIRSAPPIPPKPDKPHTTKFDICRPPYVP